MVDVTNMTPEININYTKTNGLNDERSGAYKILLLGLLCYIIFEYIRFGAWIPAIEPLHLQRIIAILTLIGFFITFKDRIQHPHILIFFLIIIVLSTTANLGNLSRARALNFFIIFLKITAIYYLISNILLTKDNLKKFVIVYLLSNVVLLVSGLMAGGYKGALSEGVFAGGFVSDSNDYALALNVVLPFFWYFFVYEKQKVRKMIWGAAFLMAVVAVIYTFSRGGFLGLCAVILYMVLMSKQKSRNFIFLIAFLLFVFMLTPSEYWEKMQTITQFGTEDMRDSSQLRLNLWKIGLAMTAKNPIFGVGPFNFPFQIIEYGSDIVPDENVLGYLGGRLAHNTFINISAELGLIGLFAFLALILSAYRNAAFSEIKFNSIELGKNYWLQALPYSIKAALISYSVSSFFLTTYHYPHIYILSALSIALKRNAINIKND